ncbi:MFS transporter [Micromonospora aurantiaca]|uniref:MFS transporter n=1 Tax=Micromonospora aurantiaca (nom. illeg.) TaxID=47850 RepID=UPI0033D908D0
MRLLPEPGPSRTLALSTLVNTVGRGTWLTASALFLTRSVGLSVTQVGVALTLTALVSLVASTPMGYLADRLGPRGLQMAALLASAGCTAALVSVRSFTGFLVVGVLMAVADAGTRGARGALIAGAVPPDQRVRTRAYLRAVTNVGISVGTVLAGFALAADTRGAYVTLILLDAATYVLAAAVLLRLPPVPPMPAPAHGPRLIALRDRPFLAFTVLDGLMSMHFSLINIALPLWIAGHTTAPNWLISVCLLVNTVVVILFRGPRLAGHRGPDRRGPGRPPGRCPARCRLRAVRRRGRRTGGGGGAVAAGRSAGARRGGAVARGGRLGHLLRPGPGARARAVPGRVRDGHATRLDGRPGGRDHARDRLGRARLAGARRGVPAARRNGAACGAMGRPDPAARTRTGAGAGRLSAVRQVPGRPAHAGVDLAGW